MSGLSLGSGLAIAGGIGGNYATITGTLTPGNIPILTATGIEDSGVALVETVDAGTVWSNNTASAAAPLANTVLTLGNGTAAAPIYSFRSGTGSGLYASGTNTPAISVNGNRVFEWSTGNATNYIQAFANSTPMLRVQGSGNVAFELASLGTGTLSLMNGTTYTLRCIGTTSAVNYAQVTQSATGNPVTIGPAGTDTNIDMLLSTKGTGVLRFGTYSALGAETVTGFITIKDSGGTTRKIAVVS